jgi:heme/copper-type cytochrome/quinol oxidase subunit 2
MSRYKSIDLFLQLIVLVIVLLGLALNDPESISPFSYYILLGVIQLVSMLIHMAAGPQSWKKVKLRKIHLVGTVIVIALVVFAFMQESFSGHSDDKEDKYSMPGLVTLVYTMIPVTLLMLFYTVISWLEWRTMKKLSQQEP